ncbi:hypothetical protein IGB42_03544 [Andreprevotia sp. IGB-42]|uniref:retropepsin-like aspartic protease family protein n=1 Tax=Andreprevotia sp. IGB-42 TaxID=2497473 RepID=UPI001359783E|nr:TIGR02281 family clan AA aspartic protease [Andreprevotia sp. IGB-42]KAF0812002.1 hypothetical protein IGB42_03544 [Andreprevotia sp. IGB-42]
MKKWMLLMVAALLSASAMADEVTLIGLLGAKAMLRINGKQQILAVGQEAGGVKLLRLDANSASVQVGKQSRTLQLGEGYVTVSASQGDGAGSIVVAADEGGHFYVDLKVNGQAQRGLIDTGASNLSMSQVMADQLHIDYQKGRQTAAKTANGLAKVWVVTVPRVDINNLALFSVEVAVIESAGLDTILVGSSVLNRFQMKRDNGVLTLIRK